MTTNREYHDVSKRRRPIHRALFIIGAGVFGILAAVVFALAFGYFVMLLWNWLMPELFHLSRITYWQAFGIVVLAKLIFGAMGKGIHHRDKNRYYDKHHWRYWKDWDSHEEEWGTRDRWSRWRHYRDFWRDEGKEAFERYVEKKESEKREKGKGEFDEKDFQ